MKEDNILKHRSYAFAVRSVNLYKFLTQQKKEFVIAKQLLRSSTSIGANIHEAIRAVSRADFKAKLSISLKEASETEYWINLLRDTEYLTCSQAESMLSDLVQIIKILMRILKTLSTDSKQYIAAEPFEDYFSSLEL